jgi:hypothetical protein
LKRLVDFFKPSSNIFGRIELGKEKANLFVKAGCFLLEFLAEHVQVRLVNFLAAITSLIPVDKSSGEVLL